MRPRALRIASLSGRRSLRNAGARLLTRLISLIKLACRRFAHAILLTRGSFTAFLGSHRSTGTRLLRGLANARVCSHVSQRVCAHDGTTSRTVGLLGGDVDLVRLLPRSRLRGLRGRGRQLVRLHAAKAGQLTRLGTRFGVIHSLIIGRRRLAGGRRRRSIRARGLGGLRRSLLTRAKCLTRFQRR